MNGKRNKKDSASASNNNYKTKSKNISAEGETTTTVKKQKKKETVNLASNGNTVEPVKVGRKRKQHDSDVDFPIAKKSRKKVKEQTGLNNTGTQDVEPSLEPNGCFDIKVKTELKTEETIIPKRAKKKNKSSTSDQYEANQNNLNITEASLQKGNKRKNKSNQVANVSSEGTNSSFLDVITLSSSSEVFPIKYSKSDIQDKLSDIDIKEQSLGSDNIVEITCKDLETDSELTESDLSKDLGKKLAKKVKKGPEALSVRKTITWPEEDLKILVNRMENCIPQNDVLAFSTRAEKLQWDVVAFKNYTVEECRNTWFLLQKQIRKFRLLKEVLADAKDWINLPTIQKARMCRHPDMPRKPLTAYLIYYLKKKDVFLEAHPGADATDVTKILSQEFKNLPHEKRLKYENLAASKKAEYQQKMNEFYQTHPDFPRMEGKRGRKKKTPKSSKPPKLPKPVKEKPAPKPPKEKIPKRPPPPFQYYYLSEVKNQKETGEEINKIEFKELCKERWKQLPDNKKLVWINLAEAEYAKYEKELKIFMESHPDYVHKDQNRSLLSKEDIQIKERVAGKPSKPPGSAYNLYARMLLQSEDIKNVPIRDRLIFVSNQWKNCAEEERKQYKDLSAKLNEKYKLDFATYLEKLPEEERKLELQKSLPKQRKSAEKKKKGKPGRKRKIPLKTAEKQIVTKKLVEPEQPPISAFKYFVTLHTGDEPAAQAWKALTSEQKKTYEEELVKKKQAYIVDFEKFLKSLTKEELEAFSNSRRKIKELEEDDEGDDDEEESSDESGTEESDADSNDEDEESDN